MPITHTETHVENLKVNEWKNHLETHHGSLSLRAGCHRQPRTGRGSIGENLAQILPYTPLDGAICVIDADLDFLGKCFVISRRGNLRVFRQSAVNPNVCVDQCTVPRRFVETGLALEKGLSHSLTD